MTWRRPEPFIMHNPSFAYLHKACLWPAGASCKDFLPCFNWMKGQGHQSGTIDLLKTNNTDTTLIRHMAAISNYSRTHLCIWIISGSICSVENRHESLSAHLIHKQQSHTFWMGFGFKPCRWYAKQSCTNLFEGYRCDLVANWISDDCHISINLNQQMTDNERG